MLEEIVARQPPSAGEPAGSDRLPAIAVSLNRLFLGGLLPSRARFRFTGHRQRCTNPNPTFSCDAASHWSCPPSPGVISTLRTG